MSNNRAKDRKAPGFYLARAGRVVLACILVAVATWPVGIKPQATQAAPAYSPQTPTPPALPTPTPTTKPPLGGEGEAAQASQTPPSPDNFPPEVEQARARQAVDAVLSKYLNYYGPRLQLDVTTFELEGEWAHAVATASNEVGALGAAGVPAEMHILAHRLPEGTWQALLPSSEGLYRQWVDAVPESLVLASEKSQLHIQAAEADASWRPRATPAVPQAATATPPSKEGPGEPIEPVPGLMQPTATPTPVLGPAYPSATPEVPPAATAMPSGKERPLRQLTEPGPTPLHLEPASSVTWAVEGNRSVVYAITDEGTRTRVTDEPFDKMLLPQFSVFITLSPDGRMITYLTADDEMLSNARLWIVNIDDMNRRLLAAFTDDLWIAPLVWSPDSTQLAFTRSVHPPLEPGIELCLIKVSTGEQTHIANTPGLISQLFYGAHPPVMHWTEHGIEYTDYVSLSGSKIIHTIDHGTGAVSQRTAELTAIESESVVIQATLPCGVSQFSQNHPDWRNTVMQTCGLTIGQAGCALTGVAMVFRYFSVNTSPSILNSCLGTSACPIYWGTAASGCSEDKASYLGSPGFSWSTIESNLSAGRPVIVQLNGSDGHYVVVVSGGGSSGSGYTINDPWDGQVKSLAAYTNNGWTPTGLRIYGGTPWCQGGTCSAPILNSPNDGYIHTSSDRTVAFNWSPPSDCTPDGYTFRVSTSPNMDIISGLPDRGEGGTSTSETFGSQWDDTDLYWSVRACRPCDPYTPGPWASPRRFRIEPDGAPQDVAEFVGQSGYPTVETGQQFSIYFEVRNAGTTTWRDSDGYGLENINGVTLGAWTRQEIGADVPPGATKRWNIQMTAPSEPGLYRTQWMLMHWGQTFGPNMFIDVTVEEAPEDAAEFVGQSGYPTVETGQQFSIYFEVRNTGTTTWRDSDGYGLENINGVTLGAWTRQEIGADVPPGATKRWDIQMTAPSEPGVYRTQWMLMHWGQTFGPNMFIDVTVEEAPEDAAEFVGQSGYLTVETGQQFSIYFEVRNTGTTTWRDSGGYGLENINGVTLGAWQRQEIGADVPPGATKRWDIQMTAPSEPGLYRTQWMLMHWGQTFGPNMFIDVTVSVSCNDQSEPNDTPSDATSLSFGQTRNGDICGLGDYDYYRFTGTAGQRIVVDIDAEDDGSLLDSYLSLFDSDGTTVLSEHDDEIIGERYDSHLGYELPHDGTYYIRVRDWDHPNVGGTDYFYTIRLLTDDINPSSAEITSPGNNAWLDPNLETITASATDNESGISRVEFWWHDADWQNSDWVWLGADQDSRDGWSWDFDTSGLAEQRGGAFYIWAFDWAGNWTGAGVWNLGIDRTPPTASADISPMYGDAPFLDFYVWWSGSDNLSGIVSYDVQYRDGSSGTWTNLLTDTTDTHYRFVGQDGHTYYFRVRARDWAGNVGTYAGGNGDAQRTVQVCGVSPDSYESDSPYSNAGWIIPGGDPQTHNIHVGEDQDWVKFEATAQTTYIIATANSGGHADTVLYLYDTNGTTLITSNDDYPGMWPASRIDWQAPADGVYYVKVDHWDPWAFGCTTAYELSIDIEGPVLDNNIYLPIILKNNDGAVPPPAMLYSKDFEDGVADDWKIFVGTWSVDEDEEGNHFWRGTGPENYPQAWLNVDYTDWTNWINYAFESRIRFVNGTVFICARADGGSAFYTAYIDSSEDWVSFAEYDGSEFNSFGGINYSIRTGEWYTVRFEVDGDRLRLYINNRLVTSAQRSGRDSGGVGYYMGGGEEIHFDDIQIWALTP